jgi:hypothetical protein
MTKPEITKRLEDWARKKKRVDNINAEADRKLAPHLAAYEKKASPIEAERDEKVAPLAADLDALEQEIRAALLSQVSPDGTAPAPVETDTAVAQVTIDRKREIDAAAFMRAVPPSQRRDPGYLGCLSVLVGRAEKFLPQMTLARLVRPKLTPSVALTLKSE